MARPPKNAMMATIRDITAAERVRNFIKSKIRRPSPNQVWNRPI